MKSFPPHPIPPLVRAKDFLAESGPGVVVVHDHQMVMAKKMHHHEFHELMVVTGGTGWHVTPAGEFAMRRGSVFLLTPGEMHGYRERKNMSMINAKFDARLMDIPLSGLGTLPGHYLLFGTFPRLTPSFKYGRGLRLNRKSLARVEALTEEIANEQQRRRDGWRVAVSVLFVQLLLTVLRGIEEAEPDAMGEVRKLDRILRFLDLHYADPLRMGDIAKLVGLSVRSLQRLFRRSLSTSPEQHLIGLRLSRGAERLSSTDERIIDIASAVGFSDSNYFTRMFTRHFGCSPRAYRQLRGTHMDGPDRTRSGIIHRQRK